MVVRSRSQVERRSASLEAFIVVDAEGRIQSLDEPAEQLFGFKRAELAGQALSVLFCAPSCWTDARGLRSGERLALRGRRKDGLELSLEGAFFPLSSEGSTAGVVVLRAPAQSLLRPVPARAELDCAAVCIVSIDTAGQILYVNDAWRRFAHDNHADQATAAGIGQNYLAVCEQSREPHAVSIAAGIRDVVTARRKRFEMVYACHSPTELRWFKLQAQRADVSGHAAVLTHINITDQRRAEARSRIQGCVAAAFASRMPLMAACRDFALTACLALDWDFFSIWQLEPTSWTLRCSDQWSRPGLDLRPLADSVRAERLGPGSGLPGRVWATRQALWVVDFAGTDLPADTLMPGAALAAGMHSGFAFPVKYDDDVLVVIQVFGRIRQQPDPELLHLLEISGVQLATSELRDRAEQRAEAAQSEADAAREQLEALLQCFPALVVAVDREGAVRFVNKPSLTTLETTPSGASLKDHFPPSTLARIEAEVQSVLTGGASTHHDVAVLDAAGNRTWSTNYVVPLRNVDQITGALVVSHDTTLLKRAYEELIDAQRLAALGTLAAGVAHEINTPIQFVGDSVNFLRDASHELFGLLRDFQALRDHVQAGATPQTLRDAAALTAQSEDRADLEYLIEHVPTAFERCTEGIARVTNIVRSMKEFAHPPHVEMAPADLNRAIMATLTVARNEYKYVADVKPELGELPPVTCHVNDINQVVLNIVVNAAHAIADKHARTGHKGLIKLRTWVDGSDAVIAISDTGGGIPEEIRHRIFEPFFTTKEVGRGTGLGLAIAWAAIKDKHAGELTFETRVGEGTTFFIRLRIAGASSGHA